MRFIEDLFDKLFEKVPYDTLIPWPPAQRYAVLAAFAGAIFILFWVFPISNQDDLIRQKEAKWSKLQKEVDALRSFAKKEAKLERELDKLEAELSEAKKVLPSQKEIPTLLEQISNFGVQAGLNFQKFVPKGEVQKTDYYAEVPVDIEVEGKFHNVLSFFDDIAHLPRIVTIGNISMKAGDKDDPTNLSVAMKAFTYRFIESAIEKKAKEKAAGKDEKDKKGKKGKKG